MATQCRGTKTKRINRHKLAVIQAYIIIDTLILISIIGSLIVGRATAPKKQVTVTETIEVPSYEANSLPVAEEVTYFDVPLSHSLQRYIYEVCADEEVPVSLVIAMIDKESRFNPETVSDTGDYGLMQINKINHETLEEQYRATDMLDPYQNVFCGVKMIGSWFARGLSLRKLVKSSSFLSICVTVVSSVLVRVMMIGTVQLLMVPVE